MKRNLNMIACYSRNNKVKEMLLFSNSGKTSSHVSTKNESVEKMGDKMQTSIIMNKQFLLPNLKKITALTAMLIFCISTVFAQDTLLVKGIVVNGLNKPVSNVSVGVEGSFELPSVTNEEGEFAVKAFTGDEWLNVSPSEMYKKKRVYLNNRTEVKIYLTANDIASGEDNLSVLSMGILKRDMVSSFSSVNSC